MKMNDRECENILYNLQFSLLKYGSWRKRKFTVEARQEFLSVYRPIQASYEAIYLI